MFKASIAGAFERALLQNENITKHICPNIQIYLSKLSNIFPVMMSLDGCCCRMKTKQNMMSLNIHENPKSQNINQICGILKGHDKMETTIKVFLYDYGDDEEEEEEEEDDHHVGSNQKVKEARMMMMTMMTPKIVVMTMIAMMTMMTMMMTILTMIMVMMIMTMMMLRRRIMLEAIKS